MAGPRGYYVQIRVRGELDEAWWSAVFSDLLVSPETDGSTQVSGTVADQAALHGLLSAIRDLGLALVSVETVALPRAPSPI